MLLKILFTYTFIVKLYSHIRYSLPSTLGDLKPSQLYGQPEAIYPDDVNRPIVREIFLKRLPQPVSLLCREWLKTHTLSEAAVMADHHYPFQHDTSTAYVAASSQGPEPPLPQNTENLVAATWTGPGDRRGMHAGGRGNRPPPTRRVVPDAHRRRATYFIDRATGRGLAIAWAIALFSRTCRETAMAASSSSDYSTSPLLFVRNTVGRRYLVDSGSEVSILPPDQQTGLSPAFSAPRLKAANGTRITVYAVGRPARLDFRLGRRYFFKFLVADVPVALIGSDILRHHGLVPDLRAGLLVDAATSRSAPACTPLSTHHDAFLQVRVDHTAAAAPADGAKFRHIRGSAAFRALLDRPQESFQPPSPQESRTP
ncbi:hypothetical protein M514_05136 [Trichuris suis]|uniref:Peptidase A2 domain-containing protein n=1 Tax=Trichuris suis TaxID=68888 RepID=A0A085MTP9_9BILA|nr:hypothetical protein M513_05136 [Trichuris suis]KFD60595.1 hypothetical protein M514_05136 [Trichuris suis]